MEKKEYQSPELRELGDFTVLTQNSWTGDGFDAAWNDGEPTGPEIYGS